MERIQWITYKGEKILFLNYSNLLEKDFIDWIKKGTDLQLREVTEKVLVLCDVTNTHSTPKIDAASRSANKLLRTNGIIQKLATVGLNKMQQIIAKAIKRDMFFCSTLEEGKEWLIKD